MPKHGKKYRKVVEGYDSQQTYPLAEAVELLKKLHYVKFDESVDLAARLGVDPRLDVQAPIVGVITEDGRVVAFPVNLVADTLDAGGDVTLDGITVTASGGGFVASDEAGDEIATHQAFWFAWSQFHPETLLWLG